MSDALKNFAASAVATAPSPATSGTSLTVAAGQGALFPAAPFDLTMWPSGAQPTAANAEIARVTAVSTDTFTITRAQYGTTAQSVATGWNVAQNLTAEMLGQYLPTGAAAGGDLTGTYPDPTLAAVGTAGTYGSATAVPVVTTDTKGRVTGVTTAAPDDTTKVPLAGGTMTGQLVVPDLSVGGLTGATAASRYVGATTSGAPTTGTFSVGDFVIDRTGKVWVCTTAGTPGTWTGVGGAALTYASSYLTSPLAMTTANANYNIASVSLEAGTWLVTGQITFNSGSGIVMHVAVGPTSASLLGQAGFAQVVSNTNSSPYSITASGVMTLTGAGTAYLVGQTGIASAVAEGSSTYRMSGIYAVKIA